MLDTHRIRVFRSVMASGTIQAAAANLGYTPSAVSQQVSALQRETGLTLFEREGRGLAPTPAAHALLAHTEDLMGQLSQLDTVVADLREGRSGRLTIGCFASAGTQWLPTLAKRLTGEMPELILSLRLTEDDLGAATSPVDIDIRIDVPGEPHRPGYTSISLADDDYVVAVATTGPFANRDSVLLTELADERWVSNESPDNLCSRIVATACEAVGFRPTYAVQTQDHYTGLAFVAAGMGVTVLPELAAQILPRGVTILPIEGVRPTRHIHALQRESAAPNRAANRAVELLREIAQTWPNAA